MEELRIKKKHLGSVNCPKCGAIIDILEREEIVQPYQKKVSHKTLEAASSVQSTLE